MTQFDEKTPEGESNETTASVDAGGEVPVGASSEGPRADRAAPDEAEDAHGPSPEEAEEVAAEVELESEAELVEDELSALHDRHLRLAAEFNNYRKRAQAQMTEAWVRAQADLVRRLLDPVDDIKRVSALDLSNATVEAIMEGIDLVERKIMRVLEEAGLEEIDSEGAAFDPNTMEAMMRVPTDTADHDDTVHQVFQKGYVLKGHLVRPARVSVLKHE